MTIARMTTLAVAACAALTVAAAADAKALKKRPAQSTTPTTTAAKVVPQVDPAVMRNFEAIDTDKNGQLSREEITAWVEAKRSEMRERVEDKIKAADTNADGSISREEAKVGLPGLYEHFEFVDADGNGQVTLAELARLHDQDAMRKQIAARVKAADQNKDGKLDLAEVAVAFPGLDQARLAQLDKNGDGFLTLEDFFRLMGQH